MESVGERRLHDSCDRITRLGGCRGGPFWDQTLCALVNDLRVCARLARRQPHHTLPMTCGNA